MGKLGVLTLKAESCRGTARGRWLRTTASMSFKALHVRLFSVPDVRSKSLQLPFNGVFYSRLAYWIVLKSQAG